MTELRGEFEKAGARLAVVSALDVGAQDFIDAVWTGGDLYVDSEETLKKALGGRSYRNWWLLKPWVLKDVASFAKKFGFGTNDTVDPKTQLLGGTFVVKDGAVVYVHRETTSFDNGSGKEVLAAVLGKSSASELPAHLQTPTQYEAVAGAAAVCSAKKPADGAEDACGR